MATRKQRLRAAAVAASAGSQPEKQQAKSPKKQARGR
jgi:hypothetical protein